MKILPRRVPVMRAVPRQLRANRMLAARRYVPGSIPRIAILLGLWDGGAVVQSAGAALDRLVDEKPGRTGR